MKISLIHVICVPFFEMVCRVGKCINYDKRIRSYVTYSALMYYKQGSEFKYFSVAKFGLNITTQYSWFDGEILWMTDIKNDNTNLYTIHGNIYFHDDNVYVVGKSDGEKIENSENNYWSNCIATKVSEDGELLWKKEYKISNYSDGFTDCIYSDNYLYVQRYKIMTIFAIDFGHFTSRITITTIY